MRKKKPISVPIQPTTSMLGQGSGFELTVHTTIEAAAFQNFQFISQAALKQGSHILGAPGAGKSRLLGRIFAWMLLILNKPGFILDPTGGVIDNLLDKIMRLPLKAQAALWPRILYINAGATDYIVPSPLYYCFNKLEPFFESANRLPSVFKRQDPDLQSAPILGWNSLYECAIYAGQIMMALGKQLDSLADLLEHPTKYKMQLRQVLAAYPELQPAVEYFRALMDPTSAGQREKRLGSFKNKLLLFLSDPTMLAMFATQTNRFNWKTLIKQRKVVLIDLRHELDPDRRQFKMIWYLKTFTDYIKYRGQAGRGEEVMLIIDEISALLRQRTKEGRSILAEDLEELITVLGRQMGVNVVLAHQGLFQLDEHMQNLVMSMGNQIIGQLAVPRDAMRAAEQLMRYDPYKVKKTENVWHTLHPLPVLSYFGGPEYPYPGVIDQRSIEFTPEEQRLAWVNKLMDLDRYQFYTQIARGEGSKKGPIQKITIANLDKNQFPNEEILAPLRGALSKRDGIPLEKLLEHIRANQIEVLPEKKLKPPKSPAKTATMKGTDDTRPVPPPSLVSNGTAADPGAPADSHPRASAPSRATSDNFWQKKKKPQQTLIANERVKAMLVAFYHGRYYTVAQLQGLFWHHPDGSLPNTLRAVQQKVQLMRDARLIREIKQPVVKGAGDLPYLYTLDEVGAYVLSQHLEIDYSEIDWKPKPLESDYIFLQHLLETHNFHCAVTLACAQSGLTLRAWDHEKVLRRSVEYVELTAPNGTVERVAVIPDSFCVLDTPLGIGHFPVEIDRRTVPLKRWQHKIESYLAYYRSGVYQKRFNAPNFRLLCVCSGQQRLQNLKAATEKVAPGDDRFWFTTFEQVLTKIPVVYQSPRTNKQNTRYKVAYNADILTTPVWYRTGSDSLHSILE